jgi:hypothetical protein
MEKYSKSFLVVSFFLLLFIFSYSVLDHFYLVGIRDQKRKEDLKSIQKALSAYLTYNRSYPETDIVSFGRSWKSSEVTYMNKVPSDPKPVLGQPYCYNNFGNIYLLCAQMEGSAYKCPSTSDNPRSCNTCTTSSGKGSYYNYCVYESY